MIEACEFELAAENDYYCTTHRVYFKNDSDCPYKHIAELEQQLAELREKYNEILYQVVNKILGETRHEAAVRIIRSHEHQLNQPEGKQ